MTNMTNVLNQDVNQLINEYNKPINSVVEKLIDRHPEEKIAFHFENESGDKTSYSYGHLKRESKIFAKSLQSLGIKKGDRVAVLLPKGPDLIISLLGIWRLGAVQVPLFTAFGPQAVFFRVDNSGAKVVITDQQNRHKLNGTENGTDAVNTDKIQVITQDANPKDNDIEFASMFETQEQLEENASVSKDDLFIIIYTSGTTGNPKGVEVPVFALAGFEIYMRYGLDLREDDIFFNMADPGWAYGLYYGIVGPTLLGQTFIISRAPFDPKKTFEIAKEYDVTNLAAAPTVYRTLRAADLDSNVIKGHKLRVLSSAGEPLNYDVIRWAESTLNLPIYDHYGQTELGMVINNHHHPSLSENYKPGATGQAMPGYTAVILDEDGNEAGPGEEGQMSIDVSQSPLFWYRGYYENKSKTAERFPYGNRYYVTGDDGSADENNHFYFSGRNDDIIISNGYRIGPFEVESSILEHEAVAEAAVVGLPDPQRGEIVKAFVVLKNNTEQSEALKNEIQQHVKTNLSAHEYPRLIDFLDELPKTPSGKIQRFLLRSE